MSAVNFSPMTILIQRCSRDNIWRFRNVFNLQTRNLITINIVALTKCMD